MSLANGGPVDESVIMNSGDIQLMKKADISLDEELLRIRIDGDYADVHVHYTWTNHGATETVDYGFPVDVLKESNLYQPNEWEKDCLPSFGFSEGKKELPYSSYMDSKELTWGTGEFTRNGLRKWFVTKLQFPAGGQKRLSVDYRVKNLFDDWEFTKSFFTEYSTREFRYRLSPSGYWGRGKAKKLKIILDLTELVRNGAVIQEVSLPKSKEYDGLWVSELEDFDLAKAEDIRVVYNVESALRTETLRKRRPKKENLVRIEASSTLKGNYNVKNLLDGDLDTVWVEGKQGSGVGEWVEVELKNYALGAIGVINGYTKNEETYRKNNRIKSLKIEVVHKSWDSKRSFETTEEIIQLPDQPFAKLNKKVFWPFTDILKNSGEPPETYKVRLTILSVYPGTEFNDTCISELFLLGYPPYDYQD